MGPGPRRRPAGRVGERQRVAHAAAVGHRADRDRGRPHLLPARRPGTQPDRGDPVARRRGPGGAGTRFAALSAEERAALLAFLEVPVIPRSPHHAPPFPPSAACPGPAAGASGRVRRRLRPSRSIRRSVARFDRLGETLRADVLAPAHADFAAAADRLAAAVDAYCAVPGEPGAGGRACRIPRCGRPLDGGPVGQLRASEPS